MIHIIAIVGASGSGKTYMAQYLKEQYKIPTIVSYTTRPMRPEEQNGVEHYFVNKDAMPSKSEMLAHTKFGGYHYWATHSQAAPHSCVTYVIDEKGLLGLIERYESKYLIIPILIKRDKKLLHAQIDSQRLQRDKHRVKFEDSFYHAIIINNGTLQDFENKIDNFINTYNILWQHHEMKKM